MTAAPVRRMVHAIARVLAVLAATAVVLIMVTTVADVSRRTTTGRSLPGTVDYGELLMVAGVFLALAFAQHRREHVSVNLVTSRLPPTAGRRVRVVGLMVAIGFVAWLAIATGQEALRSFARNEFRFGLVRVAVWPARAVIPVGAVALLLRLLVDTVDLLRSQPEGHTGVQLSNAPPSGDDPPEPA